jgi:hypothetical protein
VGCGKTILFSSIVRHLEEHAATYRGFLAYFYCLYRKGAQHELAPILRTFIAQICPQDLVPAPLQDLYELHSKKFPPGVASNAELKSTLFLILSELAHSSTSPQNVHDNQMYLLIDALDELPLGSNRVEILRFLDELAALHMPSVHILATSRDESDIRACLRSWSPLQIAKDRVTEDIRLFITREIDNHLGLSELARKQPEIKESIIRRLVDEGNGM